MLENYMARLITTIQHKYIEVEITGIYKQRICIPVDEDTELENEIDDFIENIEIDEIEFDYTEVDHGYTYEYL